MVGRILEELELNCTGNKEGRAVYAARPSLYWSGTLAQARCRRSWWAIEDSNL